MSDERQEYDSRRLRRERFIGSILVIIATVITTAGLTLLLSLALYAPTAAPANLPRNRRVEPAATADIPFLPQLAQDINWHHLQIVLQAAAIDVLAGEDMTHGSGFVIRQGVVITAAHIAQSADNPMAAPITVRCGLHAQTSAEVLAFDVIRDVMVLSAPDCEGRALRFRLNDVLVDESLASSGYDYGSDGKTRTQFFRYAALSAGAALDENHPLLEPELRERIILMRERHIPRFVAIGAPFIRGNSGSAVVDSDGLVVGMLVAIQPLHGRGFMVPATSIVKVLDDHELQ